MLCDDILLSSGTQVSNSALTLRRHFKMLIQILLAASALTVRTTRAQAPNTLAVYNPNLRTASNNASASAPCFPGLFCVLLMPFTNAIAFQQLSSSLLQRRQLQDLRLHIIFSRSLSMTLPCSQTDSQQECTRYSSALAYNTVFSPPSDSNNDKSRV